MKPSPMLSAAFELWQDLRDPRILWQVFALALCLALAWWLAARCKAWLGGRLSARAARGNAVGRPLEFVGGGFNRLLFPFLALCLVLLGRIVLERFQHANLLHVAAPLLVAFVAIRALVYLLRNVFSASGALATGERWIALAVWMAVALHFTGFLPELAAALEQMALPVGREKVSLLAVAQGVFAVALTLLVSLWASALIDERLMAAESLDMSLRVVLGRFAKALLVLVAILVSLGLAGIDLTVLSVFGGALGVGLGLGLQRIASNYFSGFIILLDRSIRIGDIITVDKYSGTVTLISTRYTVLKAMDGTEAILPNEMLVNSAVTNLSFTTRENRLAIQLAVAYDSDLATVRQVMLEAAAGHARVLAEPAPGVLLRQFGADGLELELGFWIRDPEAGSGNVRSELNFAIWEGFKAHGIEIPYPQREVRWRGEKPA
jgi:small-conductance mechanosensitive channel